MKTYAQTEGQKSFDWNKFLNRENISDSEWFEAAARASSWITCACGNQCSVIPRETNGIPKDKALLALGGGDGGFYTAIKNRDIESARHLLHMIELRSAFLIEVAKKQELEETREGVLVAVQKSFDIGLNVAEINILVSQKLSTLI
jgi:hypothetical protein